MIRKPRHRVATDQPLKTGGQVVLEGNAAHYLAHVLRLGEGAQLSLFNREDGEWLARIDQAGKKSLSLSLQGQTRTPQPGPDFWVCFAPIKGGRLETIIEKATELGASLLQPVLTNRTIVDKVNPERAAATAREAAEQCERIDWPDIREPVKLAKLLGDWPKDRMLIYGDETGEGKPIAHILSTASLPGKWGVLVGPEGGFTPEEIAMLHHAKFAIGASLGPRILRADTAVITLAALTLSAWGDWDQAPRFEGTDA